MRLRGTGSRMFQASRFFFFFFQLRGKKSHRPEGGGALSLLCSGWRLLVGQSRIRVHSPTTTRHECCSWINHEFRQPLSTVQTCWHQYNVLRFNRRTGKRKPGTMRARSCHVNQTWIFILHNTKFIKKKANTANTTHLTDLALALAQSPQDTSSRMVWLMKEEWIYHCQLEDLGDWYMTGFMGVVGLIVK